ncbi:MAG: signal peptidase I [Candidatus Heimdallarchaeota archaeon]|nr:signal peptidase I [Candidatus Heimdallarchaeota archaeon]
MYPTLIDGEQYMASSFNSLNAKRDQIVAVQNRDKLLIKRIIGLPNENIKLTVDANELRINDVRFILPTTSVEYGVLDYQWETGENEFVLLGDNPHHSLDSRKLGVFSGDQIRYRLRWGLKPLKLRLGKLLLLNKHR